MRVSFNFSHQGNLVSHLDNLVSHLDDLMSHLVTNDHNLTRGNVCMAGWDVGSPGRSRRNSPGSGSPGIQLVDTSTYYN